MGFKGTVIIFQIYLFHPTFPPFYPPFLPTNTHNPFFLPPPPPPSPTPPHTHTLS